MLQARFAILCDLARLMDEKDIGVIMRACVILHNMIVKDEWNNYELSFDYDIVEGTTSEPIVNHEHHLCYKAYFQISKEVCDPTHMYLSKHI